MIVLWRDKLAGLIEKLKWFKNKQRIYNIFIFIFILLVQIGFFGFLNPAPIHWSHCASIFGLTDFEVRLYAPLESNSYNVNDSKNFTFVLINHWQKGDVAFKIEQSDGININYTCPNLINNECPKPPLEQFNGVEDKQYIHIQAKFTQQAKGKVKICVTAYEPAYNDNKETYCEYFTPSGVNKLEQ